MKSAFFVIFLGIAFLARNANCQLRCYSCSFGQADRDRSCLTITELTPIVNCNMQYCIILRQEHVDPKGEVVSFTRSCTNNPDFLNHMVDDGTFRTYYRACSVNLCNVGSGIQLVTGGTLSAHPIINSPNLRVPGTSGGNVSIKVVSSILVLASSLICFLSHLI